MMKAAIAGLMLMFATAPAFAQSTATAVSVQAGATATALAGSLKGEGTATYTIQARGGQSVHLLFKPSNRFCYFTVSRQGAEGLVHDGTMNGDEFTTVAKEDATYKIDVFLMRNAARRNEACNYSISIDIAAAQAGANAEVSDAAMRETCVAAAAPMYGVAPGKVDASAPIRKQANGEFAIDGTIDKGGEGTKKMRCIFKPDRTLRDVMATTPDGE